VSFREDVLRLRFEGKTYNEIVRLLGCSKGTVCYYCNLERKAKHDAVQTSRRKANPIIQKVERFRGKALKSIRNKCDDFQRRLGSKSVIRNIEFTYHDVLSKIGPEPKCYLTGRLVDLSKPNTYQLDHKIPATRGGDNSLDNLGLTCKEANLAKSDMTTDELIEISKDILINFGYRVSRND
jgi:5-methylcytosine-specific restriction endonuclease McrA